MPEETVQNESTAKPVQSPTEDLKIESTPKKSKLGAIMLFIVVILILLSFGLLGFAGYVVFFKKDDATITSFEECIQAGNPVQESYPRQCRTSSGLIFFEKITITLTPTISLAVSQTPTPSLIGTSVKIYFSKNPESEENFSFTSPVTTSTNRTDVEVFSIEELIKGPSEADQNAGLYTRIKLSGTSTCSGKDFTLTIDTAKKDTLKFCKNIASSGVGDDASIQSTITDTLKQFQTVAKIVILTKDGNCFGDMSGLNSCLN